MLHVLYSTVWLRHRAASLTDYSFINVALILVLISFLIWLPLYDLRSATIAADT